jgi:hypothetical protein
MIVMSTASLVRIVRDPRSGQVHLPNERVHVLTIIQNLDRALLKVRWQAGGDCVVFPDDLNEPDARPAAREIAERQKGTKSRTDVTRLCTEL